MRSWTRLTLAPSATPGQPCTPARKTSPILLVCRHFVGSESSDKHVSRMNLAYLIQYRAILDMGVVCVTAVPSLYDSCMLVLKENIDSKSTRALL